VEFKLKREINPDEIIIPDIGLKGAAINGVIKDPEDERDFIFKAPEERDLPESFSLMEYTGEIENQLRTGSCTANAACSALEAMAKKDGKDVDLSRLFVYYFEREPYPELRKQDKGAYMRDAFKVCNKYGVPLESYWEFDESMVNEEPSEEAKKMAEDNKVIRYERIPNGDINGVKAAITEGHPVIFGMYLFESFFYIKEPLEEQNYLGRNSGTDYVGGHAMAIIGYDDNLNGGSFIVENSWSEAWGDNGHWALRYDVFNMDVMDLWVCTEFKTDLLKPEPNDDKEDDNKEDNDKKDPEKEISEEIEDFIKMVEKFIHRMLKKITEFIIEYPSMMEMWKKLLEGLKELTDYIRKTFGK